jgi:hypothetical protein
MYKMYKSFRLGVFLALLTTYYLLPTGVEAARLYIFPNYYELSQEQTVVAEFYIDTEGEQVNALDIVFSYDPNIVRIEEVSTGGSPFPLQVQSPEYLNTQGIFGMSAGAPGGFVGQGVFAKVVLQGKQQGFSSLAFGQESQVLVHDGKGTPASLTLQNAEVLVVPVISGAVQIFAEDQPEETLWYNKPFIRLNWQVQEGHTYSYILTRDPTEVPDEVPDEPVGDIKLNTPEDGIFYFRLRECFEGVCDLPVTHRIMKDTMPPEPFEIKFAEHSTAFEGKPFISFLTADATSGIVRYEVSVTRNGIEEPWVVAQSPYMIEQVKGISVIRVKAVDKAGNQAIAEFYPQQKQIPYSSFLIFGILIGIGGVTFLIYRLYKSRSTKHEIRNNDEKQKNQKV